MAKTDPEPTPEKSAPKVSDAKVEPIEPIEPIETPESVDRPPMREITGVKYTGVKFAGRASERRLSVNDLTAMGAQEPKMDLIWNAQNGYVVSVSDMNASTVDALLKTNEFDVV